MKDLTAVTLVPLLLLGLPRVGWAQETVRARFEVDLVEEARVRVLARYELRGAADTVPLELMAFGDARVEEDVVVWTAGSAGGTLELERVRPRILRSSLRIPMALGDSLYRLDLEYAVLGAREDDGDEIRWRIPLLRAGDGVAQALPETFMAEFALPPGVEAYESFPTALRPPESDQSHERAHVSLQVIPAVVTLRARRDGAPLLPPLKLLDGGVVLFLILLGGAGWRWLARLEGVA